MSTSQYLAQLIGPVMLAVACGLILQREAYRRMAREVLESPALTFLSGLLAAPTGLAVVLAHNVWVADWRLVVTALGWATFLGGVVRLIAPGQVRRLGTTMLDRRALMTAGAVTWLCAGALLTYVGYLR